MNIFVLYQPYTGGNHLANLISTDPNLNSRWEWDSYRSMIKNAHGKNTNITDSMEKWYQKNDKNVCCTHLGEFLWWREKWGNIILRKKKYQIVSLYNDIPFDQREIFPRLVKYSDEYFYHEQCALYHEKNLKIFLTDPTIYHVPLSQFIKPEISFFIKNYLNKFDCDLRMCEFAHKKWLKKLSPNMSK